jgi:two-component system, sensor histidine kinase and response regulator
MTTSTVANPSGCLLVIDDLESNIQIIGATLGKLGFEILPASSGEQAFKRLAVRRPDLILLDLLMPNMDGFEVCRRIRENPSWTAIPIIFLSSADDKDLIVRALESGGVDYITKPFNQAELIVRVRTHLDLKQARDSLKQIAEDKDEILGILTHDLKSHLGGMQMSAQILCEQAQGLEDPRLHRMAENISISSGQMLDFVKGFLANASADYGLKIQNQSVDLGTAATRAVQNYSLMAKRKQLALETICPEDGVMVRADPVALDQVIDNLFSNAIKFSETGKRITLTVLSDNQHGKLRIQDQGPGFTPEDKQRMYCRYARLSARPTGGEPSSGLGLSIARKLMRAMGGELTCESEPGHGATFTLRLLRFRPPATLITPR